MGEKAPCPHMVDQRYYFVSGIFADAGQSRVTAIPFPGGNPSLLNRNQTIYSEYAKGSRNYFESRFHMAFMRKRPEFIV